MLSEVAVVTGSSSGRGLETSVTVARKGILTYATMHNLYESSLKNILADTYFLVHEYN